MDKVKRDRLVEALSTFRGALRLFFFSGYTVGFVLLSLFSFPRYISWFAGQGFLHRRALVPAALDYPGIPQARRLRR